MSRAEPGLPYWVISTVVPRPCHRGYVVAESHPSGHLVQGAAQGQVLCELPAEPAESCAESLLAPRPTWLSSGQQCLTQPQLGVGQPFQAARRRQMKRRGAAWSPGDSPDRRFVSQEPCLHHSYRHNGNPRSAVPRVSHAFLDFGIPRIRSCVIGISVYEQQICGTVLPQPQPNLFADGTTPVGRCTVGLRGAASNQQFLDVKDEGCIG